MLPSKTYHKIRVQVENAIDLLPDPEVKENNPVNDWGLHLRLERVAAFVRKQEKKAQQAERGKLKA
jgi:hypothetical protein